MSALGLLLLVLVLLILRQPLMIMLITVIAYVHLVWGQGYLDYIIEDMWVSLNKELILAVPMFLLCGGVMTRGSGAERLVRIIRAFTGSVRGGLGVATILSCGVFSAISGSPIVALFFAGILPGLLLLGIFSAHAVIANRNMPVQKIDWAEVRAALRHGIWAALFPVILLGGIYSGFYSPTEAAAVALAYALLVEVLFHHDLSLRGYIDVVADTARLGGALFPLIAAALSLNLLLTEYRVPDQLVLLAEAYISSPVMFLIAANLLLLAVGCVMTTNEAILILAPLMLPIAAAFGFSPVHFGIMMIVNLEIGFLTPPVGLNLMVAMVTFKEKFALLVQAVLPFIALMLLGLALIAALPWLSLAFL